MVEIMGAYVIRNSPISMFALQHIDGVSTMSQRKERRHKVKVLATEHWALPPSPPQESREAAQQALIVHEELVISLEAVLASWRAVACSCFRRCSHLPMQLRLPYARDTLACLKGSLIGAE